MNKFAAALDHAMDAKGMSNTDLASKIGSSPSYVSHWRQGVRPLTVKFASRVAAQLGVSPQDISEHYARQLEAGAALKSMGVPVAPAASSLPPGHVRLEPLEDFGPLMAGFPYAVLPEPMVRSKIGFTPPEHVRWAFNPTQAMAPDIHHGALVFVDSREMQLKQVVDGMMYAFRLFGRPDVQRLLVSKRQYYVAGTSSKPVRLTQEELAELELCGRVIGAY